MTNLPKDGVWVHCPYAECDYTWRYLGRFFIYATCPSCRRNIRIQENKVESPQSGKLGGPRQIAAVENTPPMEMMYNDD